MATHITCGKLRVAGRKRRCDHLERVCAGVAPLSRPPTHSHHTHSCRCTFPTSSSLHPPYTPHPSLHLYSFHVYPSFASQLYQALDGFELTQISAAWSATPRWWIGAPPLATPAPGTHVPSDCPTADCRLGPEPPPSWPWLQLLLEKAFTHTNVSVRVWAATRLLECVAAAPDDAAALVPFDFVAAQLLTLLLHTGVEVEAMEATQPCSADLTLKNNPAPTADSPRDRSHDRPAQAKRQVGDDESHAGATTSLGRAVAKALPLYLDALIDR